MSRRPRPVRGGASVGLLTDLPPLEAGAVRYLRHWFGGAEARADLHQAFCAHLGEDLADCAFEAFGQLCDFCVTHGRRPLVRHGMSCSCLGADENCFANMLAAATMGEEEDAALLASLIVLPQQAQTLSSLAAQTGILLQHITPAQPPRRIYRPGSARLH
jgi:hypothetical protein